MTLRFASSMGEVHLPTTNVTQFLRHWATESSMATAAVSGGLFSDTAFAEGSGFIRTPTFTDQPTWTCQAAFRASADFGSIAGDAGIRFLLGGTEQLAMVIVPLPALGARSLGQQYVIEVRRGATVLATSTATFYSTRWTIFQFQATLHTTAGAFEVRAAPVDRQTVGAFVNVLSGSSINTADAAANDADQAELNYTVPNGSAVWDHFFLMDDAGTTNNDFPSGLLLVQGMVPDADGAQDDWLAQGGQGTGFQTVDDPAGGITEDIGRQTTEVIGDIFLTAFPDAGAPNFPIGGGANIAAVLFHHVSAMENSGSRTVRPIYRNSADARSQGADDVLTDTLFAGFLEVFELEPITVLAWTVQQTRDMQWGLILNA